MLVFCGSISWSTRAGNEFHGADGRDVGDHRTGIEQVDNAAHARGLARVAGIFTAASSLSTGVGKNTVVSFNVAGSGIARLSPVAADLDW